VIRLAILALALATPAVAQMPDQTPTPASALPPLKPVTYVGPDALDLPRVLPAWPAATTLASEADVQTILALQLRRTKAEEADAQADSTTTMRDFTVKLLGADATPARYPKLFALMDALHQDMRRINRAANVAQGFRMRPVRFDPRIRPSLDMVGHGDAAYPSARASSGQVWADVMSTLRPDLATAAQAEAERIAWRRVVGGVHYPSDIAGSRHVARAVGAALGRAPTFQAALAAVRAELGR
jgi:acid phosphatase (class A)